MGAPQVRSLAPNSPYLRGGRIITRRVRRSLRRDRRCRPRESLPCPLLAGAFPSCRCQLLPRHLLHQLCSSFHPRVPSRRCGGDPAGSLLSMGHLLLAPPCLRADGALVGAVGVEAVPTADLAFALPHFHRRPLVAWLQSPRRLQVLSSGPARPLHCPLRCFNIGPHSRHSMPHLARPRLRSFNLHRLPCMCLHHALTVLEVLRQRLRLVSPYCCLEGLLSLLKLQLICQGVRPCHCCQAQLKGANQAAAAQSLALPLPLHFSKESSQTAVDIDPSP